MFGENHAHIFMNGLNYRAAVNCHKNGVDTDVIHKHFQAYQEKGVSFVRDGGDALGVSERQGKLRQNTGLFIGRLFCHS